MTLLKTENEIVVLYDIKMDYRKLACDERRCSR
jgi:hypothetical protein